MQERATRIGLRHLRTHERNVLLYMAWEQHSRVKWAAIRDTYPADLRPRVYLFDIRRGRALPCQPQLLQITNGPETAMRGPPRNWTLWADPVHEALAQLQDQGNTFGWPTGDEWPARSSIAPENSSMSIPEGWGELIQSLPIAFQRPEQWGKPGVGTSINSHRTKRGQVLLTAEELRALRELRVTRGDDTRWVGVMHAAA